jgi:hypothetical protein
MAIKWISPVTTQKDASGVETYVLKVKNNETIDLLEYLEFDNVLQQHKDAWDAQVQVYQLKNDVNPKQKASMDLLAWSSDNPLFLRFQNNSGTTKSTVPQLVIDTLKKGTVTVTVNWNAGGNVLILNPPLKLEITIVTDSLLGEDGQLTPLIDSVEDYVKKAIGGVSQFLVGGLSWAGGQIGAGVNYLEESVFGGGSSGLTAKDKETALEKERDTERDLFAKILGLPSKDVISTITTASKVYNAYIKAKTFIAQAKLITAVRSLADFENLPPAYQTLFARTLGVSPKVLRRMSSIIKKLELIDNLVEKQDYEALEEALLSQLGKASIDDLDDDMKSLVTGAVFTNMSATGVVEKQFNMTDATTGVLSIINPSEEGNNICLSIAEINSADATIKSVRGSGTKIETDQTDDNSVFILLELNPGNDVELTITFDNPTPLDTIPISVKYTYYGLKPTVDAEGFEVGMVDENDRKIETIEYEATVPGTEAFVKQQQNADIQKKATNLTLQSAGVYKEFRKKQFMTIFDAVDFKNLPAPIQALAVSAGSLFGVGVGDITTYYEAISATKNLYDLSKKGFQNYDSLPPELKKKFAEKLGVSPELLGDVVKAGGNITDIASGKRTLDAKGAIDSLVSSYKDKFLEQFGPDGSNWRNYDNLDAKLQSTIAICLGFTDLTEPVYATEEITNPDGTKEVKIKKDPITGDSVVEVSSREQKGLAVKKCSAAIKRALKFQIAIRRSVELKNKMIGLGKRFKETADNIENVEGMNDFFKEAGILPDVINDLYGSAEDIAQDPFADFKDAIGNLPAFVPGAGDPKWREKENVEEKPETTDTEGGGGAGGSDGAGAPANYGTYTIYTKPGITIGEQNRVTGTVTMTGGGGGTSMWSVNESSAELTEPHVFRYAYSSGDDNVSDKYSKTSYLRGHARMGNILSKDLNKKYFTPPSFDMIESKARGENSLNPLTQPLYIGDGNIPNSETKLTPDGVELGFKPPEAAAVPEEPDKKDEVPVDQKTTTELIESLLKDSSIQSSKKDYTIEADGSVYWKSEVKLTKKAVKDGKMLIKFSKVDGYFNCSDIGLTTLESSPKIVNGTFDCSKNKLKTLKGGPEEVIAFIADGNELGASGGTGLQYSPKKIIGYVTETDKRKSIYSVSGCQLTSLGNNGIESFGPGGFNCSNNKLTNLDGMETVFSKGVYGFDCSNNLITNLDKAPTPLKLEGSGLKTTTSNYNIEKNPIKQFPTSFEKFEVNNFKCNQTELISLSFAPGVIDGDFECKGTKGKKISKQSLGKDRFKPDGFEELSTNRSVIVDVNFITDFGAIKGQVFNATTVAEATAGSGDLESTKFIPSTGNTVPQQYQGKILSPLIKLEGDLWYQEVSHISVLALWNNIKPYTPSVIGRERIESGVDPAFPFVAGVGGTASLVKGTSGKGGVQYSFAPANSTSGNWMNWSMFENTTMGWATGQPTGAMIINGKNYGAKTGHSVRGYIPVMYWLKGDPHPKVAKSSDIFAAKIGTDKPHAQNAAKQASFINNITVCVPCANMAYPKISYVGSNSPGAFVSQVKDSSGKISYFVGASKTANYPKMKAIIEAKGKQIIFYQNADPGGSFWFQSGGEIIPGKRDINYSVCIQW